MTPLSFLHPDPESALLPAARPLYQDLVVRGLDHRWALHHRSSQAFALNLFAPLDHDGVRSALALIGMEAAEVATPIFEYSDDVDRLGEARKASPHRTQVDVLLRGVTARGERLVALIEVKFTEVDFGHCSAYASPSNPRREVCRSAGLFGGDPEGCFQLANHGEGRRRYDRYLHGAPVEQPRGIRDDGGCAVRRGLNQPMRNLALAHMMLTEGEADLAAYVLCAPAGHSVIWRRFAELQATFPDTAGRSTRPLAAEQVAALHPDGGAAVAARYPPPALRPIPRAEGSPSEGTTEA